MKVLCSYESFISLSSIFWSCIDDLIHPEVSSIDLFVCGLGDAGLYFGFN